MIASCSYGHSSRCRWCTYFRAHWYVHNNKASNIDYFGLYFCCLAYHICNVHVFFLHICSNYMQILPLLQCRFYEAPYFTRLCTVTFFTPFMHVNTTALWLRPRLIIQYAFLDSLLLEFSSLTRMSMPTWLYMSQSECLTSPFFSLLFL